MTAGIEKSRENYAFVWRILFVCLKKCHIKSLLIISLMMISKHQVLDNADVTKSFLLSKNYNWNKNIIHF